MNYHTGGNEDDSSELIESVFGGALTAPKRYLLSRTKKGRTEYFQSLSTNWSKRDRWTTSRDAATGFATEGEAVDFKQSYRLRGEIVRNVIDNEAR